jgi:hypothetical protein
MKQGLQEIAQFGLNCRSRTVFMSHSSDTRLSANSSIMISDSNFGPKSNIVGFSKLLSPLSGKG